MKAIVVAIAALPVAAFAVDPADVPRGALELSGDTSFRFSSMSAEVKSDAVGDEIETDTSEWALDATALYYVAPNVGVGLTVGYEQAKEETGAVDLRARTLMIGPAISAQLPVAPRFAVYGRGAVAYAATRTWGEDVPDLEGTGYGFTLQGGAKYFPVPQLSLDVGLAYAWAKLTTDETTTPTMTIPEFDTTTSGVTVSAGLSVYLGR